jgi:hypothetical protein
MSKAAYLILSAVIYLNFFGVLSFGQNNNSSNAVTEKTETQKWREDLRFMASEMPKTHKNLFHAITREQFDAAVKNLDERLPDLARHQIIVEMARIAAMIGDGHTNIAPTRDQKIGFRALPVKLYFFKDGLFVRAAQNEYANLVGARVTKIGDSTVDEAYKRVGEIISRDNEMGVKFFAPSLLAMPEILHALRISKDLEEVKLTVEKDGKTQTISFKKFAEADLMPPDTDMSWQPKKDWVDLRDKANAPLPQWLKHDANDRFWFEFSPESRILYVQINQVKNKDEETLADFSKRLFAFADSHPVEKFVLDLRLNRGGDGTLLRPFIIGIIKSKIDQPGRFFTIMGRGTFSAAQFFLDYLENYTNAIFVGEPSSSKGNAYGDSRKIVLPNSKITVRASIYWWQDWHPADERKWIEPNVSAEMTSTDYSQNLDPAMKAILDYRSLIEK